MTDEPDGYSRCSDLTLARARRTNEMIHSELRLLHDYWQGLRQGRSVPYRAEIDPRDMRCNARNLFIMEDLGGGNIRFRLAGTALVDAFGMELRGLSARSLMEGRARESFAALIEETLAEPGIGYARIENAARREERWEVLLLPLRSDFGSIDRVLGCLHPITGTPGTVGDKRLRFRILEMSIRPVRPEGGEAARTLPVAGFADAQTPYTPPEPGARLTAIEGGRAAEDTPAGDPGRPRPDLRIVRDE